MNDIDNIGQNLRKAAELYYNMANGEMQRVRASEMRKRNVTDPLEIKVAEMLDANGVYYTHEFGNSKQRLDFYLPAYDVYIEVKKYHSERINSQMQHADNIILIQGEKSIQFLAKLLKK